MPETKVQERSHTREESVERAETTLTAKGHSKNDTGLPSSLYPQPEELASSDSGDDEDGTASYTSSPSIDLEHWSEGEVELGWDGEGSVITAGIESDSESQPPLQQWLKHQISTTSYVTPPASTVSDDALEKPESSSPLPSLCSSYPIGITARILSNIILPDDRLKPEVIEQHRKIVAARVPVALAAHRLATGASALSASPCAISTSSSVDSHFPALSVPIQSSWQADALRGVPQNIFSNNGQFNATLTRMIADAEVRCAMFDEISKKIRTDTGWSACDQGWDEDFGEEGGCGGSA